MKDKIFEVNLVVRWNGYAMDEAVLEIYLKELLSNSGALTVIEVEADESRSRSGFLNEEEIA